MRSQLWIRKILGTSIIRSGNTRVRRSTICSTVCRWIPLETLSSALPSTAATLCGTWPQRTRPFSGPTTPWSAQYQRTPGLALHSLDLLPVLQHDHRSAHQWQSRSVCGRLSKCGHRRPSVIVEANPVFPISLQVGAQPTAFLSKLQSIFSKDV